MNLGSVKQSMIKSAKEQLANHKNLGNRSRLSIVQVAELWDIVSGMHDSKTTSNIFFDNAFSLN